MSKKLFHPSLPFPKRRQSRIKRETVFHEINYLSNIYQPDFMPYRYSNRITRPRETYLRAFKGKGNFSLPQILGQFFLHFFLLVTELINN